MASLCNWFARLKSLTSIVFNESVEEIAKDWPMTPKLRRKMLGQIVVLNSDVTLNLDSLNFACLQLNFSLLARGRVNLDVSSIFCGYSCNALNRSQQRVALQQRFESSVGLCVPVPFMWLQDMRAAVAGHVFV